LASAVKSTFVSIKDIQTFCSPAQYKQQLLLLIAKARTRIYITALYLQDDNAGKEILHALYQVKTLYPALEIKVFVDFHRAQRGLIGEKNSLGNRALYLALENQYDVSIDIYGVAVKSKEVFGVLHLKGMVFDEQVFYTGGSINDIYFNQNDRYRLDRYYQITSKALADSLCKYLRTNFLDTELAPRLNGGEMPNKTQQKNIIKQLQSLLRKSSYSLAQLNLIASEKNSPKDNITITPLIGCGGRDNQLNEAIREVVQKTQTELLILTPYFNLPKPLARDVNKALKRGVKVTLIIGDKTANDFYISPEKPFTTIGIVPYLYEVLLARYVKKQQRNIDKGLLNIRLWKDSDNSFHLKGLVSDSRYHFITGSNLNPRAWVLDLENGLLLDDPKGQLMPAFEEEWSSLVKSTQLISHYSDIEQIKNYPDKPRNLLKKLRFVKIDRLLRRFL
jgi:CDP-diacylglycerol--serine O-phosphatidyltransferase